MSTTIPFPPKLSVLHLEDNPADAELVFALLEEAVPGCLVQRVSRRTEFQAALAQGGFDLILSDYSLPDFDGLSALALARTQCPDKPFIFLSGTIGEERAIEAMLNGAADYIIKDRPGRLLPAVRNALARAEETTRRRRSEEALRQNQERFRQITENVADMIAVIDLEGRRVYNNPAYRSILGDPEALRGTLSFNEIHPDDRAQIRTLFHETIRTGVGHRAEYRFLLPDGSVRQIESQGSVLRDARGNVCNVLVVSRDITERLAAELLLRERAALLDKARDAVVATGTDGRITYWNPSAVRLYGWTSSEVVGRSLLDLGLGYEAGRFQAARDQLFSAGEWRGNFTLVAKSGQTVQVDSTWSLVLADDGTPHSVLVIDTDITERRKLETQLLQSQRVESIGTLTGGVAHDLNNVLAPIMMGASLLRRSPLSPTDSRLVDHMEASARHGVELVRQLLTFAQGAEGDRREVQLGGLLKEIDPLIRQAVRGNIHCTAVVDPDERPVLADATQLKQVILNLCINARDAMPAGGELTLRVRNVVVDGTFRRRATDGRSGPHVCLSVADTGTGIPPALRERVFDPFFTTKEVGKGTGLGLSMVHGIVKGHDGFIQLESELGRGTTFFIYLPALTEPVAVSAIPGLEPPSGRGETILIIEEDPDVRSIMHSLLQLHGYQVVAADDGPSGLALLRGQSRPVAAIIIKQSSLQANASALIAGLHALQSAPSIMVLSNLGPSVNLPENTGQGLVAASLSQPTEPGPLLGTLRQMLDR